MVFFFYIRIKVLLLAVFWKLAPERKENQNTKQYTNNLAPLIVLKKIYSYFLCVSFISHLHHHNFFLLQNMFYVKGVLWFWLFKHLGCRISYKCKCYSIFNIKIISFREKILNTIILTPSTWIYLFFEILLLQKSMADLIFFIPILYLVPPGFAGAWLRVSPISSSTSAVFAAW